MLQPLFPLIKVYIWGSILSRAAGKFVGIALGFNTPAETLRYWMDMGVHMVSFGQDVDIMYGAITSKLKELKMEDGK